MEFCRILVALCIHMGASKEGETLLSSLLSVQNLPAPKSVFTRLGDDEQSRPLSMLWDFVKQQHCFSFQYKVLSSMISNGILPLSWVATKEFGPIWTRGIQALSSDSG